MPKPLVQFRIAIGVTTLMASILVGGISASQAGASSSALTASAPGITKNTIKIGILSDVTGGDASSFSDGAPAMEARFKQINAAGGIDGRIVQLVVIRAGQRDLDHAGGRGVGFRSVRRIGLTLREKACEAVGIVGDNVDLAIGGEL